MFTSRAEFRLHLRIDNADERLTPIGRRVGLVDESRWALFQHKQEQKRRFRSILETTRVDSEAVYLPKDDRPLMADWLRRPEARIRQLTGLENPIHGVLETLETEMRYAGYIAQQERQVTRLREAEQREIPGQFCYTDIPGLSREVQEEAYAGASFDVGTSGRIPGVTPAAVAVLDVYLNLSR